jgi:hypothetical protein
MTHDIETKEKTERAVRPWWNWFATEDNYHHTSFRRLHCSDHSYASEAEARAAVAGIEERIAKLASLGIKFEYLGAFPEGQRP